MSESHFCLAEMHRPRDNYTRGAVAVRPTVPPPCPGPHGSSRMYFGRRMYTQTSANSDYSDYYTNYYEMYSAQNDFKKLKRLSRSLFKLKIAYIVLTLFVVITIVAFILLNPAVSPFLAPDKPPIRSLCVKCDVVEKSCGNADILKDINDLKKLDTCCFDDLMDIIRLIPDCKPRRPSTPATGVR